MKRTFHRMRRNSMKTTGIQSLRKELDQKAIEIANMALLNEQCQQEKAALEGDLKRVLKDNDALEDRIDGLENDQPHAKYRRERALREQAERERDAIRELMNVYNLGGWTDALGPMQRALEAEATTRRLREALEQVRGLYLPP